MYDQRTRIVIIGAGMAGLSTARYFQFLTASELLNLYSGSGRPIPEIIILEGRKRVGGRINSYPIQVQEDEEPVRIELGKSEVESWKGAQIITGFGRGNPLKAVVLGQLKLDLHYLEHAATQTLLYNAQGEPVEQYLDAESERIFNFILDQCLKTLVVENKLLIVSDRHSPDIMTLEGANQVPSLGKMFDHYLTKHLEKNHLNSEQLELIHWHLANIEFSSSALLENLSLYHWDQDDPNAFDGTHSMVKGGYLQIPRAYAYGNSDVMPLDIRFDKNVISISTNTKFEDHIRDFDSARGIIKIVCADGSLYRCDAAVITSSIGLLQVFLIFLTVE